MGKQLGRHFCFHKMIHIKKVSLFLLSFIHICVCEYSDPDALDDGEERSLFTSGGVYFLALNTTTLIYYALGAGAIILLLLLLTSMTGSGEPARYGQQYGYDHFQRSGIEQTNHKSKRDTSDNDILRSLLSLANAYSKYSS